MAPLTQPSRRFSKHEVRVAIQPSRDAHRELAEIPIHDSARQLGETHVGDEVPRAIARTHAAASSVRLTHSASETFSRLAARIQRPC